MNRNLHVSGLFVNFNNYSSDRRLHQFVIICCLRVVDIIVRDFEVLRTQYTVHSLRDFNSIYPDTPEIYATVLTTNCTVQHTFICKKKQKCKAILLQAWTGPEGSSRLRLPDFKTIGTWRHIVRLIKSRRIRWAGHVARTEERRGVHKDLVGETWGKETIGETKTQTGG